MEKIGKYELREVLGRGGMGTVYRAYDPIIDRQVAVKIIQEKAVQSPELKARFVREARTAGKFSHENITVIHDMGEVDGKMFIVMEYLQGRDLRSIIDKREPLQLLDKLNYARQICKGLRYAHANGIVHRDIKPENVKVLTDGRIKIMDFGIAKPYVAEGTAVMEVTEPVLTQMGMRIGTPWYMSPEQVKGAPVDKRSDIFSFGVLLYELLTYQKPFTGDDTTVLYKILHEEPQPIRLEEAGLEAGLQRILSRCLAKSSEERYADCLLILRDIEKVPGGAGLPHIVPELLREAEELHRQERLDEAQQKFTEVLDIDPENPVARASIERLTEVKGEMTVPAPDSAEHATGEVVSHFRILHRISGGGMGVVYKAEDLTLKRIVALKFLAADWTRNPVAKKRFLKEAQAASALDHPNVCTIYEVGETPEGLLYLCMAFYEGEDLSAKIRQGPLSFDTAAGIIDGVARGLGKAHENGILHRDIKPGNILITRSGEVKIVDFGIAKLSTGTQITRAGSVVGTLPYMSPEQIKGLELDRRADLWSLAVVLYQALAGKVPFDDSSEAALFYSIVNQDPDPISSIRKDLPPTIDAFFRKALAKKPDERFATAEDFLSALRALTAAAGSSSPTGQRLEEVAALVEKGKAHLRRREYDEAITRFEAALKISPKDQELRNLRAEVLRKKPDAQKADALLRDAAQRLAEGKARDARKYIQNALALDPEHPAAAQLLEKAVAALSSAEPPKSHPEEGRRKRNVPVVALSAAGALLLAVLAYVLFKPSPEVNPPARSEQSPDTAAKVSRSTAPVSREVLPTEREEAPSKEPANPRQAENIDELRTSVAEARRTMLAARRSAEQATARQLSPTLFDQASRLETEGERASHAGTNDELLAARNSYTTAREGYSRAAADARAIRAAKNSADAGMTAMRRAKQRVTGSENEKQASPNYRHGLEAEGTGMTRYQQGNYKGAGEAFQEAERSFGAALADITAARNQQRLASEARKPPETLPREPERKDAATREREERESAQREVKRYLDQYRSAIEQGDLKDLTGLLGLNADGQRKWTLFFNNTDERRVSTELVDLNVSDGSALARFRWKIAFQSNNTPQSQELMKQWELQKDNGSWKIVNEK